MNNKAQFTPGPWQAERDTARNAYAWKVTGAKGVVEDIARLALVDSVSQIEANATLIAAAPAMYEALKALHNVLDQRMPDGRTLNQHLSQEVFECFYGPAIAARAAIAKAEGA